MSGDGVVDCRHMEPYENHSSADTVAATKIDSDVSRGPAPTSVPTAPRHHFTMTVDQVSAELLRQGFGRDDRTIQRWCKAGKLRSIVDDMHGDRYLIDPTSLHVILTTLITDRDNRSTHSFQPARPFEFAGAASRPSLGSAPTQYNSDQRFSANTQADEAPASPRHDAPNNDEVAALKKQIEELEKDKMLLTVDKQVREQMVDYLKEQFGKMIEEALDGRQEVGQLRAEVTQLRAQLPPPPPVPDWGPSEPHRFTPQQVRRQTEPMHSEATWEEASGV